jgi:regulatory protein
VRARRRTAAAGAVRLLDGAEARVVAFDLLSRKAWTRRDLMTRLRRRGAPAPVAAAVVADLEARGYLDDRAFALSWAESRARSRAIGSRRLREELLARGVARPLVDEAVAGTASGEEARASAAATRRLPILRRADPETAARRLAGYLSRRGYPAAVVRRVVQRICGAVTHDDDEE